MALQEGWPLGLHPLNAMAVGTVPGNSDREMLGSVSLDTLLTASSATSSDLDTQSAGSFFHDKGVTLGRLMGISTFLELSRRSVRTERPTEATKDRKKFKSKAWLFSLCSKLSTDAVTMNSTAAGAAASSHGPFP